MNAVRSGRCNKRGGEEPSTKAGKKNKRASAHVSDTFSDTLLRRSASRLSYSINPPRNRNLSDTEHQAWHPLLFFLIVVISSVMAGIPFVSYAADGLDLNTVISMVIASGCLSHCLGLLGIKFSIIDKGRKQT